MFARIRRLSYFPRSYWFQLIIDHTSSKVYDLWSTYDINYVQGFKLHVRSKKQAWRGLHSFPKRFPQASEKLKKLLKIQKGMWKGLGFRVAIEANLKPTCNLVIKPQMNPTGWNPPMSQCIQVKILLLKWLLVETRFFFKIKNKKIKIF